MGGELGSLIYLLVYILVGCLVLGIAQAIMVYMEVSPRIRSIGLLIVALIILVIILRALGLL